MGVRVLSHRFDRLALVGAALFGVALASSASNVRAATTAVAAGVPRTPYRDLGAASLSTPISVALTLNYRNEAELERVIALQSDERSPYYRHWLTSDEFDAAFAPAPNEYGAVIASLRRAGFRITQMYGNRTVVDAVAPAVLVDRYFSTKIDRVLQPGYGYRYANVTPALVPQDLQGLLFSVGGLDDLSVIQSDYATVRRTALSAELRRRYASSAPGLYGPISTDTGYAGYGPLAFTRAYDFPISHNSQEDGTGVAVGIVSDSAYVENDLDAFLKYFAVKRTGPATRRVFLKGASTQVTDPEMTLDASTIVGTAPGVTLSIYVIPTLKDTYITDAYARVVSDNKVAIVNSSFGGCESFGFNDAPTWDHIAKQGAALGMTFSASSGDFGASACGPGEGVSAPASSPEFVAVGGTQLQVDLNGTYQGETGWNGSGGGFSEIFALPAWQHGVKNTLKYGRNLPDVSFDAYPETGIALYYSGALPASCGSPGWNTCYDPVGGTSLASPLFCAMLAQAEQLDGARFGLVGPTLYARWKAVGYASAHDVYFHDIIIGWNGDLNTSGYRAQVGYDLITGIGSADGWNFAGLLKK
jgi:pseudomonalisin